MPLDASASAWLIEQLTAEAVVSPGLATLRAATRTSAAARLSIWDALIVQTAREAGAAVLCTEDARLLRAVNGGEEAGPDPEAVDPFGGTAPHP
jgi:predicted nucleic acid-binding protein